MKFIQILTFLLLFIFVSHLFAQQTTKASLLVAVCATEKKCEPQKIKRFNFERGKLVSSEDLLTFDANMTRPERLTYQLVQNRYVISRLSDVFDIQTKEMFDRERGDFYGDEKNQIYIFQNRGGTDVRFVSFDLQTKKYKRVELANVFFLLGLRSPSMLRSAQYNAVDHTLEIHHRDKNRTGDLDTFIDGRFVAKCRKNCKEGSTRLPMLWLDDERLLTQKKNGELVVIDLKKEETRTVVKIPIKEELESAPRLLKDFAGNIHYRADKNYLIDVENGKYKESLVTDIGNKFEVSTEPGEKIFTFDGQEIGKYQTAYYLTAKNYLAIESNNEESYYYPSKITVWSAQTQEMTTLNDSYFPKIIGWIEE